MSSVAGVAFFDSIADEVRYKAKNVEPTIEEVEKILEERVTREQQAVVLFQGLCNLFPEGFELDIPLSVTVSQPPWRILCEIAVPFVYQRAVRYLDDEEVPATA